MQVALWPVALFGKFIGFISPELPRSYIIFSLWAMATWTFFFWSRRRRRGKISLLESGIFFNSQRNVLPTSFSWKLALSLLRTIFSLCMHKYAVQIALHLSQDNSCTRWATAMSTYNVGWIRAPCKKVSICQGGQRKKDQCLSLIKHSDCVRTTGQSRNKKEIKVSSPKINDLDALDTSLEDQEN